MLALVNGNPPRLRGDYPRPTRPKGEARLRMRLAGICDTDLQLARGYMGHGGVLGHEVVADVIECDSESWLGRRVVADINAGCGQCPDCQLRSGHHCPKRSVLGILKRDGALAEELVVPERCLAAVPDSVSDEQAVFAEPLAAALHVLDELAPERPGPVIVLGDGKRGLLIALALRSADIAVTVVGHHREKLEHAHRAGARILLEQDLDPERERASAVIEATGSEGGLARALRLVEPRGTVIVKTTVAGNVQLDLSPVVINELRLVGSRCGEPKRALSVLERHEVDPLPLVAARYPLARAEDAITHAFQKGTLKVLVRGAG